MRKAFTGGSTGCRGMFATTALRRIGLPTPHHPCILFRTCLSDCDPDGARPGAAKRLANACMDTACNGNTDANENLTLRTAGW